MGRIAALEHPVSRPQVGRPKRPTCPAARRRSQCVKDGWDGWDASFGRGGDQTQTRCGGAARRAVYAVGLLELRERVAAELFLPRRRALPRCDAAHSQQFDLIVHRERIRLVEAADAAVSRPVCIGEIEALEFFVELGAPDLLDPERVEDREAVPDYAEVWLL